MVPAVSLDGTVVAFFERCTARLVHGPETTYAHLVCSKPLGGRQKRERHYQGHRPDQVPRPPRLLPREQQPHDHGQDNARRRAIARSVLVRQQVTLKERSSEREGVHSNL